jgi:hypothetical protein
MTQEEYLLERKNKKVSIIEQIMSGVSILDTKIHIRKGQDKLLNDRLIKVQLDYNDVEYTLILDAFRISKEEVVLYADLDTSYELSSHSKAFTADNRNFIVVIKSNCFDLNNGDLPSKTVTDEVVEEVFFTIQEQIQAFVDEKNRYQLELAS